MTIITGNLIGYEMSIDEARRTIAEIHRHIGIIDHHLGEVRNLIFALKDRCGWRALGYKNWRECVMHEFSQSQASIYRQFNAALVELEISPSGRIGEISERVLRPLTKRGFTPETRRAIWDIAQEIVGEGGKVTSGTVEQIVEGLQEIMVSETTYDENGEGTGLGERIAADLTARVREKRLAHKEHIRRMDTPRDYVVGGRLVKSCARMTLNGESRVSLTFELESSLEVEHLTELLKRGNPLFVSLWTEC